jgi:hypothetical protein
MFNENRSQKIGMCNRNMLHECLLNQHMFQAHVLEKTCRNEIKCSRESTLRMTKKKKERNAEDTLVQNNNCCNVTYSSLILVASSNVYFSSLLSSLYLLFSDSHKALYTSELNRIFRVLNYTRLCQQVIFSSI